MRRLRCCIGLRVPELAGVPALFPGATCRTNLPVPASYSASAPHATRPTILNCSP